jgi:hypothetical protein
VAVSSTQPHKNSSLLSAPTSSFFRLLFLIAIMSGYHSFAVWGVGDVGKHIIAEFLSRGTMPTVLTRAVSHRPHDHSVSYLFALIDILEQ